MIREDWSIARICLQVMAEQGPGLMVARADAREAAQLERSLKALGA